MSMPSSAVQRSTLGVSCEYARSGGGTNSPAFEGPWATRPDRLAGERKRAAELSDEPAIRGLGRPAVQIRTAGDVTDLCLSPDVLMAES
jgi:hypothetical protein